MQGRPGGSPHPRGGTDTPSCPLLSLQIGPRMTLELIKIQEGVGEGNVLFHRLGEGGAGSTVGPAAWSWAGSPVSWG